MYSSMDVAVLYSPVYIDNLSVIPFPTLNWNSGMMNAGLLYHAGTGTAVCDTVPPRLFASAFSFVQYDLNIYRDG